MRKHCVIIRIPAAKQNDVTLYKKMDTLDIFENQEILTYSNYKKYGVTNNNDLKKRWHYFYLH